jgi:hypothetical protein
MTDKILLDEAAALSPLWVFYALAFPAFNIILHGIE